MSNIDVNTLEPFFMANARYLALCTKTDAFDAFAHLVEEVGEIGTCINNETTKRKTLKEPITAECVDVINCALELFFKSGGTMDEFYDVITKKQQKWEDNLRNL
jgi:NTP pyrophosphatase (non-canonical NTP hydrolase)